MTNEAFHFLRPEWLWALAGLIPILLLVRRNQSSAGAWRKVCDPELLPHLIEMDGRISRRWPVVAFGLAAVATVLALAGPTWQQWPEMAYENPTQTVAVLQLTPSMTNRDIAPTRLDRARYELQDMLAAVEGSVGLVIFAEEAYGVTPLTDDPRVIDEVVPTLDPRLMPGRGRRLDRGIAEAHRLLENAGARSGRILVFADGLGDAPDQATAAAGAAQAAGYPVSVLSLNAEAEILRPLVSAGGGRLSPVEAGDGDIASLLGVGGAGADDFQSLAESGFEADRWQDAGAALLWLPLLLAPFAFRRGWAGSLGLWLILSASQPQPAQAGIADWFSRPDQRAAAAFAEGEHESAAEQFEDPEWRGVAAYRGGDLDGAIEALSPLEGVREQYNLGNALAQDGRFEEALAAYDGALEIEVDHDDARFNRELVAQWIEQQKQEQEEQQQDEGQEQEQQEEQQEEQEQEQEQAGSQEQEGGQGQSQSQGDDPQAGQEQGHAQESSQGREEGQGNASPEANSGDSDSVAESGGGAASAGSSAPEPGQAENSADMQTEAPRPQDRPLAGEGQLGAETGEGPEQGPGAVSKSAPMSEEEQEIEQWLGRVPDDPGGLLREKLRRRYAEKRAGYGLRQGGSRW